MERTVFVAPDSGGIMWLDGQLVVALNEGVDPNDFFATGYSSWQRFIDNQYIATPESGGGLGALNLANQLSTDSRVEWATPNFLPASPPRPRQTIRNSTINGR